MLIMVLDEWISIQSRLLLVLVKGLDNDKVSSVFNALKVLTR